MANYEEQLERVRRWYGRFKQLNDGMEHPTPCDMYIDIIYAFFQNCYHLKDWLKNDPAYTKHTRTQIENYVKKTQSLSICADICNGSKHLTLNHAPSSGDVPKVGKKVITIDIGHSLSGEEFPTMVKMQVEVEHAGKKRDAFQLATDALQAWESFIT